MPPPGSGSKASRDYYKKAKKDYKKKTGFSTVDKKMRADKEKKAYGMQENITKDEKATDKAKINVGSGTGEGRQTTDFIDDLKDAYKSGLFTGGTKTKAFMEKYGLTGRDIAKLRTGIDQGLGQILGKDRTNVLQEMVDDLGAKGILTTSGPGAEFLQQRASEIYEPGMKKSNIFLPYEDPQNIFEKGANLATKFNPFVNIVSGIFGSSPAQRATYFGNLKGLEGEELDNFAAAVANDRNLYNQLMSTPEMQQYELNEFRAEANRNMIANRSDPDPISGTQPGAGGGDDSGGSDEGTTDLGSSYTPSLQNTYTFFDPNLGRYRSGTYDEYLQYVTAKDGGIIQLSQGGNDEDPIAENKKVNLRNILAFIRENKDLRKELENMTTETDDQELVKSKSQKLR